MKTIDSNFPKRRNLKKSYKKNVRKYPRRSSASESFTASVLIVIRQVIKAVIIVVLIIAMLFGGVGAGMLAGYISTATPLNVMQLQSANETSYIYDSAGKVIAKLTGSQNVDREYVRYNRFSNTYLDEAFVAIEDERFDTHIGIDFKRIGGAILSFIKTAGNPTSGGSTITQQVVKMISGDDQRSAQRKIQEWYNAVLLEKQLKKWEIMELYANLVPMGNSFVGIQSAAKGYFGKDVSELNLAECAFLVGVPNLPGKYNPMTESGRRNAFRRQRLVLSKMQELGKITDAERVEALNTDIRFVTKVRNDAIVVNSYFVDYTINKVKNDLMKKRGYSSSLALTTIYNYGTQIYTTLDTSIQNAMDKAFTTEKLFISDPKVVADFPEHAQAGMVVMEVGSAQIKAMGGGFGVKDANFVLNRAAGLQRQPGSTIKPLAVYGPALDMGVISLSTTVEDKQLFLNNQDPNNPYPKNSYTGFYGFMTMRNAIKVSSNTVAAQVWMKLKGINSLAYLKSIGMDRPGENYVSIALGGFNKGMSPLDMAAGYSVFPNNGQYAEPVCYTKVTDVNNRDLLDGTPKFYQAYKPETAAVMNSFLLEPLRPKNNAFAHNGTGAGYTIKNAKGEDITTAGKTGTADGYRDKWFVGYTPYYVGAVWYGYDGRLKSINIPKPDFSNGIKIWHNVMTAVHAKLTPKDFYYPPSLIHQDICISSGKLAHAGCAAAGQYVLNELFIPGSPANPTEYCHLHQSPASSELSSAVVSGDSSGSEISGFLSDVSSVSSQISSISSSNSSSAASSKSP